MKSNENLLLDVGLAGYSSWQVDDDSGSAGATDPVKDEVHAVGFQVGVTHVPRNMTLTFHCFYEYASEDRFQGQSIGLNVAMKF